MNAVPTTGARYLLEMSRPLHAGASLQYQERLRSYGTREAQVEVH